MATITVRIHPMVNEWLETVSSQTGLTKSAIILYSMNDTLRRDRGTLDLQKVQIVAKGKPIRFTLRMPISLKALAERRAKEADITVNSLVTYCLYRAWTLYWSSYSFD